jgi:LCP family protein required for cell wall assembly
LRGALRFDRTVQPPSGAPGDPSGEIDLYPEPIRRPVKRSRLLVAFLAFVFPLFLCGGLISGYYFYDTVRQYVASAYLPDYGSVSPAPAQGQQPVASVSSPPNILTGERINVLLLGIDNGEAEVGPYRSDTMIVATLDPKNHTGGMLSIPRDLYVPIPYPGIGQNRINTANFFGDAYKYPGGGPALAVKTVEYNLGIPIHYYVRINFGGFVKIVDTLGGIDVDVPAPIDDPTYPTENYGTMVLHIPAGHLHMNGELALEYARSRHTTSDFDRSKRQRQIILAARDKALQMNILPKLPVLYVQFKDSIETDMTPQQILALASIAAQVPSENIQSLAIDQSMTYNVTLNDGAEVLWPERPKIAALINEMFSSPAASSGARAPNP